MGSFVDRVKSRSAVVGVIGQGYVGLPLALVFAEAGLPDGGLRCRRREDRRLEARAVLHPAPRAPSGSRAAVESGHFSATLDFDRLEKCDAIIICVPTPLGKHREPDNSYIHATAREIAKRLRPGQLVVLESTTYPGTTEEELLPILAESRLSTPRDFLLAFSPEREDPGNAKFSTRTIPKVVGGINPESTAAAVALYQAALDTGRAGVARARRGVVQAARERLPVGQHRPGQRAEDGPSRAWASTSGRSSRRPAPSPSASCRSTRGRAWAGTAFRSIRSTCRGRRPSTACGRASSSWPARSTPRCPATWCRAWSEALNDDGLPLKGARVLVLGLSYKANVDDTRESPSFELIELLRTGGARGRVLRPALPRGAAHAQVQPGHEVRAVHGRGLRRFRRRAGGDRARPVQGPEAVVRRPAGGRHPQPDRAAVQGPPRSGPAAAGQGVSGAAAVTRSGSTCVR